MVNTKFILGINVLLQSDLWNQVKGQTKTGRKMDKRTGTDKEIYNKCLHSLHSSAWCGVQITWQTKVEGTSTYLWPMFTPNVNMKGTFDLNMKTCTLDLLQF